MVGWRKLAVSTCSRQSADHAAPVQPRWPLSVERPAVDSRKCAAFWWLVVERLAVGAASVAGWPSVYETRYRHWVSPCWLSYLCRVPSGSCGDRFPLASPLSGGTVCWPLNRLAKHSCHARYGQLAIASPANALRLPIPGLPAMAMPRPSKPGYRGGSERRDSRRADRIGNHRQPCSRGADVRRKRSGRCWSSRPLDRPRMCPARYGA